MVCHSAVLSSPVPLTWEASAPSRFLDNRRHGSSVATLWRQNCTEKGIIISPQIYNPGGGSRNQRGGPTEGLIGEL